MILEGIMAAIALLNAFNGYRNSENTRSIINNTFNNSNNSAEKLNVGQSATQQTENEKSDGIITRSANAVSSCCQHIINHPVQTTMLAGCAMYAWIYYTLSNTQHILKNPQSWCNFKIDAQASQEAMLQELKQQIFSRYTLDHNHATSNKLQQLFLNDAKKELQMLQNYLFWENNIPCNQLKILFPFTCRPEQIELKITYLKYLLNLYLRDMATKQEFLM